ncbi:hypothetical protein IOD16_38965 [Saccharothrix sp. 6-C]|uniref:Uncharacterized protein n=1 Tax=Saccharothrix texasensis TaxID=103734 RepID=A0A3N1H8R6_9PSEU|nr:MULTISPECIES: hypothetical protein [Saccharothrix]QQQ76867.1 hypothetical protein IOD16_38965 [Saccharothrix sp. 6-C]ROP38816.1 hypothetical protein EDD40_4180 [Saccharothrix texasensis]
MTANPPGVDELDPAELEKQFAGDEESVDGLDPKDDLHDVPPATPQGHHQTHSAPVALDTAPVAGS